MKWGVRRARRKETKQIKKDRKNASKYRRSLSDKELNDRISRLEKEKRLKQLTNEDLKPGRSEVSRILGQTGKKVLGTVATGIALYGIKFAITGQFNPQDAAGYVAPKPKNK